METPNIIFLEGIESERLLKTDEDKERFNEEYREKVVPILEEQRRRRILSLQEAQTRIVN